jgi:hypothetical protein
MIFMFIIAPLFVCGINVAVFYGIIGMTLINTFLAGMIACAVFGSLWSRASNGRGVGDEMFFMIVFWVAAIIFFFAWILGMAICFYGGA